TTPLFAQDFAILSKQRAFQPARSFDLPERVPAMLNSVKIVESPNTRQQCQLLPVEGGDSYDQILSRPERTAFFARAVDSLCGLLAQPLRITESEPQRQDSVQLVLYRAGPFRALHIHRVHT